MFKSIIDAATDITKIAAAPIEMAADATRTVTKPLANAAEQIKDDFKETSRDLIDND